MADLGTLADQGTPLASDLGQSAAALGREFKALTPFATTARDALIDLGAAAAEVAGAARGDDAAGPAARASSGTQAAPAASVLDRLTASLDKTGAIGQLMAVLFYGTTAANGYDSLGHYVRDALLVGDCTGYAITPVPGCSAKFTKGSAAADTASAASATAGAARRRRASEQGHGQAGASVAQATAAP